MTKIQVRCLDPIGCDRTARAELAEIADGTREGLTDQAARTIASWWQAPGPVGHVLASFASGSPVDPDDLEGDIAATMRSMQPLGLDESHELECLDAWIHPAALAQFDADLARILAEDDADAPLSDDDARTIAEAWEEGVESLLGEHDDPSGEWPSALGRFAHGQTFDAERAAREAAALSESAAMLSGTEHAYPDGAQTAFFRLRKHFLSHQTV